MILVSGVIWVIDAFLFIGNQKILAAPFFVIILCGLAGWFIQHFIVFSTHLITTDDKDKAANKAVVMNSILLIFFSFICFITKDNFFGLLTYACGGSVVYFIITLFSNKKVKS